MSVSRYILVLSAFCFLFSAAGAQTRPDTAGWTRATPPDSGLSTAKLQEMSVAVRTDQFKKIGSILIARHDKLVYDDYIDGNVDTLRDTRSVTKSITDVLVGIAIEEGKLSGVEAKVATLLPDHARRMQNPDPRKLQITVEDFLTMSSPLECDDWNQLSRGNEDRMYLVEDWAQFIFDLPIRGRIRVGEQTETPPYGRYFSYCSGGVFVLSEVLEKATGVRTDRYAQEKLFAPLEIQNAQWVYSPLNTPQTAGSLRLRSIDLLKVGQLYLDGGRWHGRQIVAEEWVRNSTRPHVRVEDATEYGYLWWLKSFQHAGKSYPGYFMSGNGGNKVVVVPQLDLVVAITSTNYNTQGMHEQAEKLLTDYVLASVVP
jgi:CubicO group peptidase (beta-lactamase class C family)